MRGMSHITTQIPPVDQVRKLMLRLNQAGLRELSERTGNPFMNLQKVRLGTTKRPAYNLIRTILPLLDELASVEAFQSHDYRAELEQAAERGQS